MIILGVDPGLASTGWAVLEKTSQNRLVDYGCVKTAAGLDFSNRLGHLFQAMEDLIKQFSPEVMAVEELFFAQNVKTAIKVAQAQGVIKLAGAQSGLKVVEYTPLNIKMSITGYGRGDKRQIEFMVKKLLNLEKEIRPSHAADAAAVALTHIFTNQNLK
ncbi:crossover junction endodeoxyribonuclease RuvC [Patescibacteria group bacterium]|nr:crossover junction endodeoxyribonuclease RuvC [Patescibacteria group bacterium]